MRLPVIRADGICGICHLRALRDCGTQSPVKSFPMFTPDHIVSPLEIAMVGGGLIALARVLLVIVVAFIAAMRRDTIDFHT